MTGLLLSISSIIPGIVWNKHHQTSFPSKDVLLYLTFIWFRLSCASIYHSKQTLIIRPTNCKLRDREKPLQLAVIGSRIHVEFKLLVGCYLLHSDMKLTIYSSGLPTSFRYHLPLQFHNTKSCIHKHLSQLTMDMKQANHWALHSISHSLAHSKNADPC